MPPAEYESQKNATNSEKAVGNSGTHPPTELKYDVVRERVCESWELRVETRTQNSERNSVCEEKRPKMCIAAFVWQSHPRYTLLLLLNRDEYRNRWDSIWVLLLNSLLVFLIGFWCDLICSKTVRVWIVQGNVPFAVVGRQPRDFGGKRCGGRRDMAGLYQRWQVGFSHKCKGASETWTM